MWGKIEQKSWAGEDEPCSGLSSARWTRFGRWSGENSRWMSWISPWSTSRSERTRRRSLGNEGVRDRSKRLIEKLALERFRVARSGKEQTVSALDGDRVNKMLHTRESGERVESSRVINMILWSILQVNDILPPLKSCHFEQWLYISFGGQVLCSLYLRLHQLSTFPLEFSLSIIRNP